ncbi:MAG: thioredoxin domain-containing protein [Acidimicrobiales bacterium]
MDRTTALVLVEAVAIGFLGLLVAGLLRSHAEILRQLHRLGAGVDIDAPEVDDVLAGRTPTGDAVSFALDRAGERTMLLFLSSGCTTCAPLWDGLTRGEHRRALPGVRVIVVTRDADEESPSRLAGRAPADVPVVLSSETWTRYRVPGSPYAVLVEAGAVVGDGVARAWPQLGSLVLQHLGDRAMGERRADDELRAAGIHPGHPSLYAS